MKHPKPASPWRTEAPWSRLSLKRCCLVALQMAFCSAFSALLRPEVPGLGLGFQGFFKGLKDFNRSCGSRGLQGVFWVFVGGFVRILRVASGSGFRNFRRAACGRTRRSRGGVRVWGLLQHLLWWGPSGLLSLGCIGCRVWW